jgi:hypothetical protein
MISIALIALSAILWAAMDTLAFHRPVSIWKNASDFWTVDKGAFLPYTRYRWNAWHIAKSGVLACLIGAAVLYKPLLGHWLDFFAVGAAWIAVFNVFFNRILKA